MKYTIVLLIFGLCGFLNTSAQVNQKYYFDVDGNKTIASNASFSISKESYGNYTGTYSNTKKCFSGSILLLDSNSFFKSKFSDTVKWFFKNGEEERRRKYIIKMGN